MEKDGDTVSTKIVHGYRMPLLPLRELNRWVVSFKEKVEAVTRVRASALLASQFAEVLDEWAFDPDRSDNVVIHREVYQGLSDRYAEVKRSGIRDPEVDFDCEIVFFPLEDQILLYLLSEQKNVHELMASESTVSYYGYWDNCDRDPSCTEKEWEKRREDWGKALPGAGVLSENGMLVTITSGFPSLYDIGRHSMMASLPSFEERVSRISMERLVKEVYTENGERYYAALKEARSDKSRERLEAWEGRAREVLIKEFDDECVYWTYESISKRRK